MFVKLTQSKWSKTFKLSLIAVLCLVVLSACGEKDSNASINFSGVESDVKVATYKGGDVTDKEFEVFKSTLAFSQGMDKTLFDMEGYREYVLEQYVVYKNIAATATEEVKKAAEAEGKEQLESFKSYITQMGVDLDEMQTEYGIKEADLSTFFYLGSIVSGHLDSLVTTEELSTEYNSNLADYSIYDVRHILISKEVTDEEDNVTQTRTEEETLALAQEAKAKLDAGEGWDTVAASYSDDPGSKANGGLYTATKGMNWEENFKQAAFTQDIGVIGEPVKSDFGHHVMLVEKRESAKFEELDETVLDELRYYISNAKFGEYYDANIEELEVVLNLPVIETPEAAEGTEGTTTETTTP